MSAHYAATGQEAYEARLQAEWEDQQDDDGLLSEEQAREIARDENDRTPAFFADWLSTAADDAKRDRKPADMGALRRRVEDGEPLTVGNWLALLVAGDEADAKRARYALLDAFRAAPVSVEFVQGRAAEILAAQEEQRDEAEGAHYDAMAERWAA